jgi:hypothetical protein
MTVSRATIEEAVSRWEKKARAETYLSENLHPKARGWLVDEVEKVMTISVVARPLTPEQIEELKMPVPNHTIQVVQAAVSDAEYDRIASEPPPRKGKNKG